MEPERVIPKHKITLKQKLEFVKYYQVTDSYFDSIKRKVRNPIYKGTQVEGRGSPLSNASVKLPCRNLYFTVVIDGYWHDYTEYHRYVSEKFKSYAPKYSYVFMERSVLLTQRIHKVKDKLVYTADILSEGFEPDRPRIFVYTPLDVIKQLTKDYKKLLLESEQDGLDKIISLFRAVKSFELKSRPHWLRAAERGILPGRRESERSIETS